MMNENGLKKLQEAIKNGKDLELYFDGDYYDTFKRVGNNYQGQFGQMSISNIIQFCKDPSSAVKFKIKE